MRGLRRLLWLVIGLLTVALLLRYCVRFEPAEQTMSPPQKARQAPGRADQSLIIPVAGIAPEQLTDTFTQARDEGARRHDAIDIIAPLGTPVLAAAPGHIEKLFKSDRGGNTIYVRSPDSRWVYYYAHLDRYEAGLSEGQQVAAGDVLGAVGLSGNAGSAGPHLHFAINRMAAGEKWYQGTPINPYPLLMAGKDLPLANQGQQEW
ncbi:M23 family metallopeptidase [Rhizorhapis suberifaciens]|nr:M23 family metallopeptidase [Rhizorhapis suberifaciens]